MMWKPPHPSVYIIEEMDERGWDRDLLATMMVAGVSDEQAALAWYEEHPREEWEPRLSITRLSLDMYFEVGPTDTRLRLGDSALKFSRAFGTSDAFFSNLERSWLRGQGVTDAVALERGQGDRE